MTNQFNKKIKVRYFIFVIIFFLLYYQIDYKRYFIKNNDCSKTITIWQRLGNNCYIIPGKYFWIFTPRKNYIKTKNYRNYIGIIWNTMDKYEFKISIYNDYEYIHPEGDKIKIYSKNDSLVYEYKILEVLSYFADKRKWSDERDSLINYYDYNYIDLNRICGIKIYYGKGDK
jgi:hypothetical protein